MMDFALPTAVVLAGAGLILAVLAVLQRLRPRRRLVVRATASLWRAAAGDTPARRLGGRFRHWPFFVLVAAIALALWLAVARPEGARSGGVQLFFLDSSAAMASPGSEASARRALLADVRAAAADGRSVHVGGNPPATLLLPGESTSLLSYRLGAVGISPAPAGFSRWLRERIARRSTGAPVTVHYYGSPAGLRDVPSRLAPGVTLVRGYVAPVVADNRGIVELGVAPAASGAGDRADAVIAAIDARGTPLDPGELVVSLGGRERRGATRDPGSGSIRLRDLPAHGETLTVALRRGDGFPGDDQASIRLPDRSPIRVAIGAGVPAALRAAVTADPALAVADADTAKVAIRRSDDRTLARLPSLDVAADGAGGDTFLFAVPHGESTDLRRRLEETGVGRIDAAALAGQTGRAVTVGVETDAPARGITVRAALFGQGSDFTKSAAAPLFVSQSLRWLARQQPWPSDEPPPPAGLVGAGIGEATALQAAKAPVRTGILDATTTLGVTQAAAAAPAGTGDRAGGQPFVLLLLAAALLLMVEWWLYQTGRMP